MLTLLSGRNIRLVALALAVAIPSNHALAWGKTGHRITGYVAERLLTPEARVRLNLIIPAADLAEVSTWMDEQRIPLKRAIPDSNKWHYVNQPVCANKRNMPVCPHGDCVLTQINKYWQALANPKTSREDQAFAVRVLVHMIGDIHQPLHAADNNDRGGNDVRIGKGRNSLHAVWDTVLVQKLSRGHTPQDVATSALARYDKDISTWQTGAVYNWAAESNQLAKTLAYGTLPNFSCNTIIGPLDRLPATYIDHALPVVERQLVIAGARIAYVLNSALTGKI